MSRLKLHKHTLNLREGDMEVIHAYCKGKNVTAHQIIRKIVSSYVDKVLTPQSDPESVMRDLGDLEI